MDVIRRLNELRLERDLSVYRLAELSGVNQSTLANTFSRGTVPSIKNLEILCETMGLTLAQFFAGEEEETPTTESERALLNHYRRLPRSVRASVDTLLKTLAETDSET